jgi:hypothetical protein
LNRKHLYQILYLFINQKRVAFVGLPLNELKVVQEAFEGTHEVINTGKFSPYYIVNPIYLTIILF